MCVCVCVYTTYCTDCQERLCCTTRLDIFCRLAVRFSISLHLDGFQKNQTSVRCCLTSAETIGSIWTATSTFTQFLSSVVLKKAGGFIFYVGGGGVLKL